MAIDENAPRDWDAGLAELLDEETSGVLVDAPDLPPEPVTQRPTERRAVLPHWLRSRDAFTSTLRWTAATAWHVTAFHAARSPFYLGKLAFYSPRGVWRSLVGWGRWVADREALALRLSAVHRDDPEEYRKLIMHRDNRVRLRATISAIVAVLLLCSGLTTWLVASGDTLMWYGIPLLTALVMVLGYVGRSKDVPIMSTATVSRRAPKLDHDTVVHALTVLGIPAITSRVAKNPHALRFPEPISRDGNGWRAVVDLPSGVTAEQVMEKRSELASGLGRPLGCVWPEPVPAAHPGRLVIWVGDVEMSQAKPLPWPLAKAGVVDLFTGVPFGTDPRGRLVTITLMFASVVIGSIPRMGKTFAMRLLLLAAALDVRAELHAYDLKGTGDFGPLEPVCHRYRSGDDDDDIAYALADLRELQTELRRRAKVIRELPRHLCPENKVTPQLASMKTYRLHPIVVTADECQRWFEHPEHGKEIEAICEDLVRRGPALGIIAMFGTQRPDAKSLPTGISSNAVIRFCLKVMGHTANDMVLGTGMNKAGIKASMFARSDKGIGYLAGEADDPQIVRTFNIDGPAAEKIVARAREQREKAGTLTGHALGTDNSEPATSGNPHRILDDVLMVVGPAEPKIHSAVIAERLADLHPDLYAGWKGEHVTKALAHYGIKAGQTWYAGANSSGVTREDILNAVTQRKRFGGDNPAA